MNRGSSALAGKRCLVTGASGGLGEELARELSRLECRLFLTGGSAEKLRSVAQKLADSGRVDGAIPADFRHDSDLQHLVDGVLERMGGLDILVNNAGVFPVGPLAALGTAELDECLAVNLRSAILLCRAFVPGMAERGWGRVINIASSSAYAGFAETAAYCASKHGLLGLSRALDEEFRSRGVRVISVSPGSIKTPMGRKVRGQSYDTFLEPAEIARVVGDIAALDGTALVSELRLGRMTMR